MKFDLTKNVILDAPWQKRYLLSRIILLAVFILAGIFFFYRVFFPIQDFSLNFSNLNAKGDTLSADMNQADKIIFNAYSPENFSDTKIQASLNKESLDLTGNIVLLRKTYAAFAYPNASAPASFPEGSLEQNNGQYYIVSNGKLRKFQSPAIVAALGYPKDAFEEASAEELGYGEKGSDITDAKNFPDGALFLVDSTHYQIKNQVLVPFVSEKAYLSRYGKNQAIGKGKEFLKNYTLGKESIGFADNTLLSFDIGVFVVVSGKVMPFNNPITFLSFGYEWEDIVPASEEEIGLYQRDKLFSVDRPHPDGTVFFAEDSGKYYLINGGQKYEIKGAEILGKYLKKSPIIAQERSLEFQNYCQLKPIWWPLRSYGCSTAVKNLEGFSGNDYQFETEKSGDISMTAAGVKFYRNLNWKNMRDTLSDIKHKFLVNYGYATQ